MMKAQRVPNEAIPSPVGLQALPLWGSSGLMTAGDGKHEICVRHTTSCYINGRDEGISDYSELGRMGYK
jgi:hypothetical protein